MTQNQVEKFAVGYPYPTDYVEILLKKYNYDVAMVHGILSSDYEKVINEVQTK